MMPYILHAGLILAACLIFYKILLQRETFFRLNRWVLMVCLVLSFGLPLIEVPQQWSFQRAETPAVVPVATIVNDQPASAPTVSTPITENNTVAEKKGIEWAVILIWTMRLYWLGVIIFSINFLLQIITLLYRAYTRPVIKDGRFRIVELAGDNAPCSFGNNIFINPAKYDWETYTQVLEHEKIHVQERHTLDLIVAELVIIFQWFNPFAWWYRKALENNLEFLTDDRLLDHPEVEKTTYQLSLLKVSAPHFPLSLTTNYNQSLLKKRVAMMNAKKSNVHTTWKYLFLLPVLVLSVCLLNQPKLKAQDVTNKKENKKNRDGIPTEGYWFATIKEDKVNMQFKSDEEDNSHNNTTFQLSDFRNLPREGSGNFSATRDAGTLEFTGKFEGNQGMGRYKFVADKAYKDAMAKEGVTFEKEGDQLVFFFVDVKRNYVQMLKNNGYKDFDKDQLIPLAALKVDEAFINGFKNKGYKEVPLDDLIPLKAVGVTPEYIDEIRNAGYKNVSLDQLVTFKAQNISGKYISDMRSVKNKANADKANDANRNNNKKENENENNDDENDAHQIVAMKALHITDEYINSLKAAGYDNLDEDELIPLKAQGVTAEWIKSLKSQGFGELSVHDLIAIKAHHITAEYLKSFESVGYPKISVQKALPLKTLNVTPEFIKSFNEIGYKKISLDDAVSMKAQSITPAVVRDYNDLGFGTVPMHDIIAAKATGTSPAYIKGMIEKGHKLSSVQKYVSLKSVLED